MPARKLSSDELWRNVQGPADVRKLLQRPYDRLVELLLLIRRPQWIPDPGPELRSALDAVIVYQLSNAISNRARRKEVQRFAARQLMKFLGR
jgi:hypothetical protein